MCGRLLINDNCACQDISYENFDSNQAFTELLMMSFGLSEFEEKRGIRDHF